MPAYFSVDFQYKKADIGNLDEIYNSLLACGLTFKGGFYDSKNDTWDEIIAWNQAKFDDDFELDDAEHYSQDYKQMLFEFYDFSEVRFFILNFRGDDIIRFLLIIPENEFVKYTKLYEAMKQTDRMQLIEQLAIDMWSHSNLCCIQTGWEGSECSTSMSEIMEGMEPLIEPFAIVPSDLYRAEWDCTKKEIERNGAFLYNNEHWNYF